MTSDLLLARKLARELSETGYLEGPAGNLEQMRRAETYIRAFLRAQHKGERRVKAWVTRSGGKLCAGAIKLKGDIPGYIAYTPPKAKTPKK
jgi:hypothetical protein